MAIIKRKIENLKPGKEYIVTARAKNADVNVVSNYTDTIRFVVPVDTTIPQEVFNLKLYQSIENVMFVFDNVSDKDISTYEYELYSDISGTQLVSTGYNDASVFTVAVSNLQTDAQGEGLVPYWGRVRAIDTSGNMGAWTPLSKTDERVPLIDNQFIGSLTASKITAGSIGAHEIVLTQPGVQTTISTPPGNAVLRSSNYDGSYNAATQTWSEATSGWIITGDGRAEFNNAVIRGNFKSISLDVGSGNESFHINSQGQVWAGSETFETAKFSIAPNGTVKISQGSISIGEGITSFNVDDAGNLWMGATTFDDATFRVSRNGDVRVSRSFEVGSWLSPALFRGIVLMESRLVSNNTFSWNEFRGDLLIGDSNNRDFSGFIDLNPGNTSYPYYDLVAPPSGYNSINYPLGHTTVTIRRAKDVPITLPNDINPNTGQPYDRQSNWYRQILRIYNEGTASDLTLGGNKVAGIALGVGQFGGYMKGCTLRVFPGAGASPAGSWISGLTDDPITISGVTYNPTGRNVLSSTTGATEGYSGVTFGGMDGSGGNGFDVGNFAGTGFGFVGAASFVIRSSKDYKENIEYMPIESRNISIERIRNLKPVRWDDKAKLSHGAPNEKFKRINEKWIAKGKTPLQPNFSHYEVVEHDCSKDNCIGNDLKNCPEVEFQKKRYGFVAEDVAEVFPKAVQFSTLGNPIGIDYSVITYSLVETTQHLLDKIDQLEAKISELTAENNN